VTAEELRRPERRHRLVRVRSARVDPCRRPLARPQRRRRAAEGRLEGAERLAGLLGGLELYNKLLQKELKMNVLSAPERK
jgi:hypothetical protein